MSKFRIRPAYVAVALAFAGFAAQAAPYQAAPTQQQPGRPGPDGPGRPGGPGRDFSDLNLTADQKTKLDALMRENRPQGGKTGTPGTPPTDADRQAMESRRTAMDAQVKGILTPEQYTKYQSHRGQHGPRPDGKGPAGKAPAGKINMKKGKVKAKK
ncbi:MAG: hypothetical protein ACRYFX_23400 [Janthinobacterium lividum]